MESKTDNSLLTTHNMNLSELSLRRPVLAIVCSIVIIIFGGIGYKYLGVREYPAIDPAVVNVRTSYVGANSDIIEQQITEPLEKAVNGVPGVKNITSSSSTGSSNITVEFEINVDLERAANDVRDKVSQALGQLPQDIDSPPTVARRISLIVSLYAESFAGSIQSRIEYRLPKTFTPLTPEIVCNRSCTTFSA